MPDGGPFENVFAAVALTDGDRIQRYEIFDVTDAEQALARFAELSGEEILQRPPWPEAESAKCAASICGGVGPSA